MGAEPDTSLTDSINAAGIQAIGVGDCQEVGYIEGAILSGRRAALDISRPVEKAETGVAA